MRMVFILLTAAFLQTSAGTMAQNVTLSVKNAPLEQVFRSIKKQSGYAFFFDYSWLKQALPVTLTAKEMPLRQVLDSCFREQPFTYEIVNKNIFLKLKRVEPQPTAVANYEPPPIDVKGRITNENDEPVAASVIVKGTKKGTTTDLNGEFHLEGINADAVLVITATNIEKQEFHINGKQSILVRVKTAVNAMEDVVVVGYGTQKKEDVTGAVATVGKKQIENRPVTNAVAALQGTAPGLTITRSSGQPGKEGYEAQIRGFSSINGSNTALVLIDGVEGDLSLLNPNDIESVSVLKDAAAASIYGAKAAGGVLLVTTKKGSVNKLALTYTGLATFNHAYGMPKKIHSWEQATMLNEALVNAGSNPRFSDEQIGWMKDPAVEYKVNPNNPGVYDYYYDLNHMDQILRKTSLSQNHNVALSGGNDKTQYLFSVGYFKQDGIFKVGNNDKTERYNARLNVNTVFNNIFSLDSRISYAQSTSLNPSDDISEDYGLFMNAYQLASWYPIFLPGSNDTKYARTSSGAKTYQILKDGGYGEQIRNSIDGLFTLKAQNFVKGLMLRLVYSPQLSMLSTDNFEKTIPFYDIGPDPARYLFNPNDITKIRTTQTRTNVQALADYDLSISTNNHFHVLGGYQYQYYNLNTTISGASALISATVPSLNLSSDPTVPPTAGDDIQSNVLISYFGRANYNYKEKYFLEGTLRNDASSQLSPGKRSQYFPSVSAAWKLDNEPWFRKSLGFFKTFKLRASWGKLGNSNVLGNYDYISMLSLGTAYPFNNTRNNSLYQAVLASPDKTWETIETSNLGIDLGLLDNRLTGSFDYYVRRNNNMLVVLNAPATLGLTPSATNSAELKTWGWEAAAGWRDRVNKLNYWINLNISDNKNEVVRYDGQNVISEGLNPIIEGHPINSLYGYEAQGYFKDAADVAGHAFQDSRTGPGDIKYVDQNKDEKIDGGSNRPDDHGDLVYLGNTSPRYSFGANLGVEWNGFDLSMLLQGVGKRNMMIYSYAVVPFVEPWRMPWAINQDYWKPDHQDALFPRLYTEGTQNTFTSSKWVQDAAYIRLKNLQVGYTLPQPWTSRVKIQRARIFFSGQDLWESSKMWYKQFDPENPNNAAYNYPFFRSYAIGLNVTF
ncbi:MAG: TonB-dependent receptor [Agriterribacter sp.]